MTRWRIHRTGEELTYGLELAASSLVAAGHEVDGEAGDPVAASMPWSERAQDLSRVDWQSPVVVFGGLGATANPAAAMASGATHVWCGDGDDWRGDIESTHVAALGRSPAARCVHSPLVPRDFSGNTGAQNRGTLRWQHDAWIEIARGCKRKCTFCLYGWIVPYREAALSDIAAAIANVGNRKIRVLAADQLAHSCSTQIREALTSMGHTPMLEGTAERLLQLPAEVLTQHAKSLTIGLEGYTERLRSSVGKPISDDELVKIGVEATRAGIKSHSWFVIYGLPGERESDHAEFIDLVGRYVNAMRSSATFGVKLLVRFHPFMPSPQTPYQWAAAGYGYDRARLAAIARAVASMRAPKCSLTCRPLWTSDGRLLWRMIQIRGNELCRELFAGATPEVCARSPRLVRRTFRDLVGFDPLAELPIGTTLPWDRFVDYPRAKLSKIWEGARRRLGLDGPA